jgi:hypothetical protein
MSSRLPSASKTSAVKSSEDRILVIVDPSSAEDERSPLPVSESEDCTSKVTSQVTESKFRRLVFSLVVI